MFNDLFRLASDFFAKLAVQIVAPFVVDYVKDFILKKTVF